jgi:hypothetical protein
MALQAADELVFGINYCNIEVLATKKKVDPALQ